MLCYLVQVHFAYQGFGWAWQPASQAGVQRSQAPHPIQVHTVSHGALDLSHQLSHFLHWSHSEHLEDARTFPF